MNYGLWIASSLLSKLVETERIMSEEVMPQYLRLMEDKENFDKFKDITLEYIKWADAYR